MPLLTHSDCERLDLFIDNLTADKLTSLQTDILFGHTLKRDTHPQQLTVIMKKHGIKLKRFTPKSSTFNQSLKTY
jgi:hypothetical protein